MSNNNKPQNKRPINKVSPKLKSNQKRKTDKGQLMLYKLLVFLIAFSVIVVIAIICISCSHNYTAPTETQGKVTLDSTGETTNKNADMSTYLIGDILYIDFSSLALECNMIITGTENEQTFTVVNDVASEYIKFTANSDIAIVNGVEVKMRSKALLRNNSIWIAADFIKNTVMGVTVDYNSDANILTIKRNELNASTPQNPKYEKIYFAYNITKPADTVEDTNKKEPVIETPKYTFIQDLSEYEKYMDPDNPQDYLVIANRQNKLSKDFVPKDLVLVYKASGTADKYKMTKTAAMAFEALVKEAKANGLNIFAVSGYRSYATQEYLFNRYVNQHINEDGMTYEQAFAQASTYSQIAGASEHQTGLTMDVNRTEQDFGDTKEGKWLAENAYKFGFVIRYPADKESITGIDWEPWHLRYVGRSNAVVMKEKNMCLEEYVEYLKNN